MTRETCWYNSAGALMQIAVAHLCPECWDLRCEATVEIGPFDDVRLEYDRARKGARQLIARQDPCDCTLPRDQLELDLRPPAGSGA